MNLKYFLRKRIAPIVIAASISGVSLEYLPLSVSATESITIEDINVLKSDLFSNIDEKNNWLKEQINNMSEYDITEVKTIIYKGKNDKTKYFYVNEIYTDYEMAKNRYDELNNSEEYNCAVSFDSFDLKEDYKPNLNRIFDMSFSPNYYLSLPKYFITNTNPTTIYRLKGSMFKTIKYDMYEVEIYYKDKKLENNDSLDKVKIKSIGDKNMFTEY